MIQAFKYLIQQLPNETMKPNKIKRYIQIQNKYIFSLFVRMWSLQPLCMRKVLITFPKTFSSLRRDVHIWGWLSFNICTSDLPYEDLNCEHEHTFRIHNSTNRVVKF